MVRVLHPGGLLLLADHVAASAPPLRAVQRLTELGSVPFMGEHFRRRPADEIRARGLKVLELERFAAGVVERLAGLAVGHHLQRRGRSFVVVDRETEIGAVWRNRWDSLRLFTPAGFSHLPGLPFPGPPDAAPTKDAMADHLAAYARHFGLPVKLRTTVGSVDRDGDRLRVIAIDGREWRARDVVLATGAHGRPNVPWFATDLDPAITQLHSLDYRRPAQLPDGTVLVVGAGNSGAETATDLASDGRDVRLSGRDVGHIPRLGTWTYPLMRMLGRPGVALSRRGLGGGAELGLRPDHGIVSLPVCDGDGRLIHRRGITAVPGLYAVGLPNQPSITSHLVGGVGTDARRVVEHLVRRSAP